MYYIRRGNVKRVTKYFEKLMSAYLQYVRSTAYSSPNVHMKAYEQKPSRKR